MSLPKIVCVVGPTSSGKTALALALAKEFGGEIVNADARQVYRGFDIGTGKPKGVWKEGAYLVDGVPHHLMDDVDPKATRTVTEWRESAVQKIHEIVGRGKLPIIVGGTGLFIRALVDNLVPPAVPPQEAWRASMETKPLTELVARLKEVDPEAAETVDLQNPRRVLRALEVVETTGEPLSGQRKKGEPLVSALLLAPEMDRKTLYRRIDVAVDRMLANGWVDEVRKLHASGIAWEAPAMTSIGYRDVARFLQGEIPEGEMIRRIKRDTRRYAKRQLTWFRADSRVQWVKTAVEASELVRNHRAS